MDESEVKKKLEIERLKRKYLIEKINDYGDIIVIKVFGLGSLTIGVSELLVPSFLPIVLTNPVTATGLIGTGMAFLLNKKARSVAQKFLKLLDDEQDEQ
ncbi:MAG: hypothetical protein QNJ55_29095 [Xenococcus sp. MO_188.B8]|nr:hypothetical protein [Xenococcus sp. MO_188.B8]